MSDYVLFDSEGNYQNTIVCHGDYQLPEGWTRQLLEPGQFWEDGKITSFQEQFDAMSKKITLKEI